MGAARAAASVAIAAGIAAIVVYLRSRRRAKLGSAPSAPLCSEQWSQEVPDKQVRDKAKAHLKFGNACARSGFPEKALSQYAAALNVWPGYAAAHHNAGGVCQRLKRFEEAVVHYLAALAAKPSLVEAASNLAVAQLNCGRPMDALLSCRRAIELQATAGDGLNREAFHHLNVALRLLGRRGQAVEETWTQVAALQPAGSAWSRPRAVEFNSDAPILGAPVLLTVACVKWGDKYGPEYVNKLARACRRQLTHGCRFVCFTEDGEGLDAEVEVVALPDRHWEGWWFKAALFSAEAALSGRVLFLDLDTVLVGPIDALARYRGPLALLSSAGFSAEEGNADGYNTSAMLWDAGGAESSSLSALHDALCAEVFGCLMRWDHWVEMVVPRAHLLQVRSSSPMARVTARPQNRFESDGCAMSRGRLHTASAADELLFRGRTSFPVYSPTTARTAPPACPLAPRSCASRATPSRTRPTRHGSMRIGRSGRRASERVFAHCSRSSCSLAALGFARDSESRHHRASCIDAT